MTVMLTMEESRREQAGRFAVVNQWQRDSQRDHGGKSLWDDVMGELRQEIIPGGGRQNRIGVGRVRVMKRPRGGERGMRQDRPPLASSTENDTILYIQKEAAIVNQRESTIQQALLLFLLFPEVLAYYGIHSNTTIVQVLCSSVALRIVLYGSSILFQHCSS